MFAIQMDLNEAYPPAEDIEFVVQGKLSALADERLDQQAALDLAIQPFVQPEPVGRSQPAARAAADGVPILLAGAHECTLVAAVP